MFSLKLNIPIIKIHFRYLILLCLVVFSMPTYAQYWMQKAGGITIDEAADVALDPLNNAYSVGYYTGQAFFGGNVLSAVGVTDIFVAKTDNSGNYSWMLSAGGSGSDRAEAVAVDAQGNVYVTGYFSGTANFGSNALTAAGLQDVFIAKYNTNGIFQWVAQAGGGGSDFGFGIDVNNVGDIFVTGSFKNTANFGAHSVTAANTTSDIFVAKLNASGVFQWVKSGSGNYSNLGRSLGTDDFGNVYVTGQFSDTLTFDIVHNNQSQNIIFLAKFDSIGAEKWFTTLDGAISNVIHDLAADGAGNLFLTGDFNGIMSVYDINSGVASTIFSSFSNAVFTAKYDSSGVWTQKGAIGSNNPISSKSIAIDAAGNYYIGGDFECDFTEFSNSYGEANFLSVGGKDVFVAKFNANGTWDYSRNIGGKGEDLCFGVAVSSSGEIHAVGSFEGSLHIPVSSNFAASNLMFWTTSGCTSSNSYCNDPSYGNYKSLSAQGNKDLFILNGFDPNREPFDFYMRSGSSCVKDLIPIRIENGVDTIRACSIATLTVTPQMCASIAPEVTYYWNNRSSTGPTLNVITTGWNYVEEEHIDLCFTRMDSIYVIIETKPDVPHISDGKGFNYLDIVTEPIQLCIPDTTLITGGGFSAGDTYWWTGPGLGTGVFDSVIIVSGQGVYVFHVETPQGCANTNSVLVNENLPLPPFNLQMLLGDTVQVCFPDPFTVQLYDSVSNPLASPACLTTNAFAGSSFWGSDSGLIYQTFCDAYAYFKVDSSGTYTIYDTTIRQNFCYQDTHTISNSVYVKLNPKPIVVPFPITLTGNPILCPGGINELNASGAPNYKWFGSGVNGLTDSTVFISAPGTYRVQSTVEDTNSFGCTAQVVITESMNVYYKSQPTITTTDNIICPNSSVTLTSSSFIGNAWEGPNGPIAGGQNILVSDPGSYFSVVNDADSCGLVSNTLTLYQYTTPRIEAIGDTVLCPGASTILYVQANSSATVTWNAPLTGSNPIQNITSPGTYSCSILSCGITTTASIVIHAGNPAAQIVPMGVLCADSSVVLVGPAGMASYNWLPSNQTTPNITVDTSGTYTLSIVDVNGCAGTSPPFLVSTIEVNAGLTQNSYGFCEGDSLHLEADSNLASYFWLPGGETTPEISITQAGSYSLNVIDSNGCESIGLPITVNQSASVVAILQTGDSVICDMDTVILSPVTQGYSSYLWMPGNSVAANLEVTQTGVYSVIAVDSIGCQIASDSFHIQVLDLPISDINPKGLLCKDSVLVLEGPVGLSQYLWSPSNETTPNITVSNPGLYQLSIIDSNGCESIPFSYQVDEIVVSAAITNTSFGFCYGDSLILYANTGMAGYKWMPSGEIVDSIVVKETEGITLTVTDTNGCRGSVGPVQISESDQMTQISISGNEEICEGDTVIVTAANLNYASYNWQPKGSTTPEISVTEPGTVWLEVMDSIGCIISSDSITIVVIDNDLEAPTVTVDSLVCLGTSVTFIADAGSDSIYWYNALGAPSFFLGNSWTTTIASNTVYYLQTVSAPCKSEITTVNVFPEDCDKPIVSNVFTPNGDGVNDYWYIEITGATCYQVDIYNRWGMLLYTLESQSEHWDGTVEKSNRDVSDGTYYYILNYCDYRYQEFSETGYITLIRQ